jgi:protein O-mannosyl-transferase
MRDVPDNHLLLLGALGLVALTVSAYWHVQGLEFVSYDDGLYVLQNDQVLRGLTLENFLWAFRSTEASNWHPVTWLSLMLDASLFKLSAGGYHWTNLLLHVANTVLLLWVLRRITGENGKSLFVAALFAVHPLHVESVAWVAERKDVLSGFFWMLSLAAYFSYVKRPGGLRYSLLLLAFIFSLMSKPMVVTLPFVLLLLDFWPLGRWGATVRPVTDGSMFDASAPRFESQQITRLIAEKVPLFILAGLSSAVTFVIQQRDCAVAAADQLPLVARLANVALLTHPISGR